MRDMASERFSREKPYLAEAPAAVMAVETDADTPDLLTRLEKQAAECGRLEGRVEALEQAVKTEREARRKLAETLKRERAAARAIHERAERAEAELATARGELETLQGALDASEHEVQLARAQMKQLEHQLAWKCRSPLRKLLRRPPA